MPWEDLCKLRAECQTIFCKTWASTRARGTSSLWQRRLTIHATQLIGQVLREKRSHLHIWSQKELFCAKVVWWLLVVFFRPGNIGKAPLLITHYKWSSEFLASCFLSFETRFLVACPDSPFLLQGSRSFELFCSLNFVFMPLRMICGNQFSLPGRCQRSNSYPAWPKHP